MIDNIQDIHEQLYKPLLNFTVGYCRDVDLAENVVADVFSILLEKQEPPPDLRGWLFLTAKYEVIHHFRQNNHFESIQYARDKSGSLDLRPVEEEALERIAYEEQIRKILPLIEILSPYQRRVLHLRLFQDSSNREAADVLNTTESHAKTIYGRALERIRKRVGVSLKGARNVGVCSYGACKKKIVSNAGFCKKHLGIKQAAWVRRNQHKKSGWH